MAGKKRAKIDHEQIRSLLTTNNGDQKATLKAYRGKRGVRRPKEQSLKNAIKRMAERMAEERRQTARRRANKYDPRSHTPSKWDGPQQHHPQGFANSPFLKSAGLSEMHKRVTMPQARSLLLKYQDELPQTEKEISALKAALGALEARQKLLRERTASLEDWLNEPTTLEICDWLDE